MHETDTVSRLGGDEFGIIIAKIEHSDEIKTLIKQLDFEITKSFEFEGQEINLRASIGYALFKEDGIEIDVLIEKADKSMYKVKRVRKGHENVR